MKYVRIIENDEYIECLGIYDNYHEALGHIMDGIFEHKANYEGEGDEYTFSDPYELEGGGEGITVKFKYSSWDKAEEERHYILTVEE